MMDQLAQALEAVASTSSRLRKVARLATFLAPLDDADLSRAARFLSGSPVAGVEGGKMSVGGAILREAAVLASGWPVEMVRLCHREVGDSGEAFAHLLFGKSREEALSLAQAEAIYMRLLQSRRTADKVELLRETMLRIRPLTLKYFIKVITGNFRIGLQERLVEEAIAQATGAKVGEVKDANNRTGDLAQVALAARRGELKSLEARLFHPLEFMLAKPLDEGDAFPDAGEWYVEDKYDGIRSQVHFRDGKVKIFTRGLEDTTAAFPELVAALSALPGSGVMDGEVLAWREGRALNFSRLQQRLARKKLSAALQEEIPVIFLGYDLLYRDGELLLDAAIEERRRRLAEIFAGQELPLLLSPQEALGSAAAIDARFEAARERGNEGLLLKRKGSLYESAKRSQFWLKVKRALSTLDVVVTAAEQGSGRRATMLSDYTFAVRDGERFLNVGKAYSGLSDDEIRELTKIFRSLARERYGRVTLVEPRMVLEVAFDGIQQSPRHKSGFALRFPRILRWRQDKQPSEADTLERVRELYEKTLR
jgi:DNA ligase 1